MTDGSSGDLAGQRVVRGREAECGAGIGTMRNNAATVIA
jgi:hypothetical protein